VFDGATADQVKTIQRSLGSQVQSLRVRSALTPDPAEALFAAIGLMGAELCSLQPSADIEAHVARLDTVLARQLDADGLHLSRNPRLQLALLVELTSLRRALGRHGSTAMTQLGNRIDRMHEALDDLTLSSGEPAYFNGCGQVPHDVLVAIQSAGPVSGRNSRLVGGYGVIRSGRSVIIGDSGLRPPPGFDGEAHDGALAFEFTHGSELIVGSCGPAPSDLPESRDLFRQSVAHSAPTFDTDDTPQRARRASAPPGLALDKPEHMLVMTTSHLSAQYGVEIERRLTLLSEGTTLVGQDKLIADGSPQGHLAVRFHLGPGVTVRRTSGESIARLILPNQQVWSFLWEGASFREDDSVRQSAYLGFHRTKQLVLEAEATAGREIAWIFTLEH
jgi:uncharacterized heparinase superfamily protein